MRVLATILMLWAAAAGAVTVRSVTSARAIQSVTNAPVSLTTTLSYRTTSAASTNNNAIKDRIYKVFAGATTVTDYQLASSQLSLWGSSNPSIPVAQDGSVTFNANPGSTFILSTGGRGTFVSIITLSSATGASSSNFLAFAPGSLASNINFTTVQAFTGKSSANWPYNTAQPGDLMTNATAWTAPVPIASMSQSPECALVAPNAMVSVNHFHPIVGQQVSVKDTNGVVYRPLVSSVASGPNDFCVVILQSNMPPAAVPASVLPVSWTNKISLLQSFFVVWTRPNSGHVNLGYAYAYPVSYIYGGGNGLQCLLAITNTFGNDVNGDGSYGATAGDSSSPSFALLGGAAVFLGATSSPGHFMSDFVSDPVYWNFLTNTLGGASTLSVVDTSPYNTY